MSFVAVEHALLVPRNTVKRKGYLTIYAICGNGRVRYVGVTRKSLMQRLRRHLEEPTNAAMGAWFKSAYLDGVAIKMVPLEYVSSDEWEDAERGWIHWFRQRGTLLNVDRGGRARDALGRPRQFVPGEYIQPSKKSKSAIRCREGNSGSVWDRARSTVTTQVSQNATKHLVGDELAGTAVRIRRPRQVPVKEDCGAEGNDFGGRSSLLQSRVPTPFAH